MESCSGVILCVCMFLSFATGGNNHHIQQDRTTKGKRHGYWYACLCVCVCVCVCACAHVCKFSLHQISICYCVGSDCESALNCHNIYRRCLSYSALVYEYQPCGHCHGNPGVGGRTSCHALTNLVVQCSVKSSDSVHCRPYWVLFVHFLWVVCHTKAKKKHVLWFTATISNMQLSHHGRWAHPYPEISLTFWQCGDILPLEQKVFQALIPIDPLENFVAMSVYLFNLCKSP